MSEGRCFCVEISNKNYIKKKLFFSKEKKENYLISLKNMNPAWLCVSSPITGSLSDVRSALGSRDFEKALQICASLLLQKNTDEIAIMKICVQGLYEIGKKEEAKELFPKYYKEEGQIPIALLPIYTRLLSDMGLKENAISIAAARLGNHKNPTSDSLDLYITFIEELVEEDVKLYVESTYENYFSVDEERVTDSRDYVLKKLSENTLQKVSKSAPVPSPSTSPTSSTTKTSVAAPVSRPVITPPAPVSLLSKIISNIPPWMQSGHRIPIIISIISAVILFMMKKTPPKSTISL